MRRQEILQIAKTILFNTDMVRAILDGRKTVTRRLIKPQPTVYTEKELMERALSGDDPYGFTVGVTTPEKLLEKCPYQPGDIMYVRETWGVSNLDYNDNVAYIVYKASENEKDEGCREVRLPNDKFEKLYDSMEENSADWHPSIHMPKEAARIFLRVTNVRVERLQDISEEDVVAEGAESLIQCPREHAIIEPDGTTGDMCWNTGYCKQCDYINKSYGELFGEIVWNNTIKKSDLPRYGWAANPRVWVIEFERVKM